MIMHVIVLEVTLKKIRC